MANITRLWALPLICTTVFIVSCGAPDEKKETAGSNFYTPTHAPAQLKGQELAGSVESVLPLDFLTVAEGGVSDSYSKSNFAVDWVRDRAYFLSSSSDPTTSAIRSFRISTMTEDRQARISDVTSTGAGNYPGAVHTDVDGHLYLTIGGGNARPIVRVDRDSLVEVARFGYSSNWTTNTTERFGALSWMAAVQTAQGGPSYLITGSLFSDIGVLRSRDMAYVWGAGQRVDERRIGGIVSGAPGEGWILGTNTGTSNDRLGIYHAVIAPYAYYDSSQKMTYGVLVTKVATITPAQIIPGATSFYGAGGGLTYDPTDDSVIFSAAVGGNVRAVKWRADNIIWNVPTPFKINYQGPFQSQNRLDNGLWTLVRGSRLIQLDTATGEVVTDIKLSSVDEWGAQVYDGVTDTHLVRSTGGWTRISLRQQELSK